MNIFFICIGLFLLFIIGSVMYRNRIMKEILDLTFNGKEHRKRVEEVVYEINKKGLNRCKLARNILLKIIKAVDEKRDLIKKHALIYGSFLIRTEIYLNGVNYNEYVVNELNVLRHIFYQTFGHKVHYYDKIRTNEINIKVNHFNEKIRNNSLHLSITLSIQTEATLDDYDWKKFFTK